MCGCGCCIYETYKIQWCHMDVKFVPKHLIWKWLKCVHILIMIIHFYTGNLYHDAVLNVHVLIFMTKKQIISIQTHHPQYGCSFITSLWFVLLMIEFYWNTREYVICVNSNLHQKNIQKYTFRKELVMMDTSIFYQTYKVWPFTYHMCAYLVQIIVVSCDTQA